MLKITWITDPEVYVRGRKPDESPTKIAGCRRAEHKDLPSVERLMRPESYDMFGDVELGRIYEASCLSMVQYNEKQDVVSCVCLCNYPNVPAVPRHDWPTWLQTLYGLENFTETNAMFVHLLLWDKRYTGQFFDELLTGLFSVASYLQHAILVLPPQVIPADVFEQQLIRIPAIGVKDNYSVQSLYVTVRHLDNPRLKIRRVVEEDNDEVIPIVDAESTKLKEFYGEYYISEMVRYPDDHRRLIVSEDDGGLATGLLCLNRTIDVDILNENFELTPYNGLRKPHADDRLPAEYLRPASEIFFSVFSRKPEEYLPNSCEPSNPPSAEESVSSSESVYEKRETLQSDEIPEERISELIDDFLHDSTTDKSLNPSDMTFLKDLPSISDYFNMYYQSKVKATVFADTTSDYPRRSAAPTTETAASEKIREVTPLYHGATDAFALEIFAAQKKEMENRWSRNFLEAAFDCFPDLDYCAILLPFSHPHFPFLEHFARVPLRCNKDFPMTLYVTHRALLFGELKSRKGEPGDRDALEVFLRAVPKTQNVLADFEEATREGGSKLSSYVFECSGTMIGVAVLCCEEDFDFISRRYHVEDYVSMQNIPRDGYGRILHFVLMPIFSVYQRAFFREIMRLSGLTVLYYRLSESACSALTRFSPLANCLNAMVPVAPRKRIEYKFRGYLETDEIAKENRDENVFSLFMTTPRLASFPASVVDLRIVIVGASDCGLAFAERLALGSRKNFARFASLTLISPNGLPFETEPVASMIPFRGRYSREYRRLVAARAWINVVYGEVSAIQRKQKYVTVLSQGNITYDYLILTCGLQYHGPQFVGEQKGEPTEYEMPWNCLTINDDTEASVCLEKIQLLTNNFEDRKAIIFYGHNVDCYCALHGLIDFGLNGSWITLIEPPLSRCETHANIFFDDCHVDTEVMNGILKSNVAVLLGWTVINWSLKETTEGKLIESLILESKGKLKTLNCDVFINFNEKTINPQIFLAICRAGLVFDGQLVIDPECRTNDPFIFAAGTVTKYSRKFYAESWEHKYNNSVEVGERLAKIVQKVVSARQRVEEPAPPSKGKMYLTLPVFRTPIIVACVLPGGYRYLHVRKPGKSVLRKIAIRHEFYGEVMMTGSCASEIGYFRIRLNLRDSVETVTCVNRKEFEVHHMIALYGKHESMLNELKTRFRNSLIADFYEYFREPWATAIFYDRFECLRVENRATLLSQTIVPGDSLVEDCVRALIKSKWETISEKDRRSIEAKYAGSIYHQELEESLHDFLLFSEQDLPMYCTPTKLRELYADIENSVLFQDV